MGDTGSLALARALGTIAIITKHELVLAIIGGLFVLEAVSVIVQVASFKLTGKRVFRRWRHCITISSSAAGPKAPLLFGFGLFPSSSRWSARHVEAEVIDDCIADIFR